MGARLSRWGSLRPPLLLLLYLLGPILALTSTSSCVFLLLLASGARPAECVQAVRTSYVSRDFVSTSRLERQAENLPLYRVSEPVPVPSCHIPSQSEKDMAKHVRRVYIKEQEVPLSLITSERPSQQFLTHIFAIFLKEFLGYINVTITVARGSLSPDDWIAAMNGIGLNRSLSRSHGPYAMINLEVWIPPVFSRRLPPYPFQTSKYLGTGGRFGWFMVSSLPDRHDCILEHWRVFAIADSEALEVFSRTTQELDEITRDLTRDPVKGTYFCEEPECERGMYIPSRCRVKGQVCAVLFAGYPDIARFLYDQIEEQGLYVQVAWIGSNLTPSFIEQNQQLEGPGDRSVLIFHWWPSVLLQSFDVISVAFPPCTDSSLITSSDQKYICKYEMHHIYKYVWDDLTKYAGFAAEATELIHLSTHEYLSLMQWYSQNSPGTSVESAACRWMQSKSKSTLLGHLQRMNSHKKQTLYLVGIMPITSPKRKFLAPGNVPAFRAAIDAVNRNVSILKNYKIEPHLLDGKCEPDIVMKSFIDIIKTTSSNKDFDRWVGIVGPACSDTIEPIAGVSKHFRLAIISYGAEGAIFSDQEQYPYFFRTIPENKSFRYVYLQLFKKLKWSVVASLTKNGERYSEYHTLLQDLLEDSGIVLHTRKYPQSLESLNMSNYLVHIKNQKSRIIIGDFYTDIAREIMCEAYLQKMTGMQGYVWFLPRWLNPEWYDTDKANKNTSHPVPCSTEQMKEALRGHMSLSYSYFAKDDDVMQEGITVGEWRAEYAKRAKLQNVSESEYAGFTYDAVWTYAYALDKLFKENQSHASSFHSLKTTRQFMKYIKESDFHGVSGHIKFKNGASRVTDIYVWQFTDNDYVEVGRFYHDPENTGKGTLDLYMSKLVWPTGELPTDGSKECFVEGFRAALGTAVTCTTAIIILCTMCFGGLTLLLVICFLLFKRRYEKKLQQMQDHWRRKTLYEMFDGWEIPRDEVVINRKLGEGAFGTVYGGECQFDPQGWVAVAVKTLKVGSTISERLDFLTEAEMMKNFDHENIVRLLGVCTKIEPIYTVMEFMLYGDLKTYLLARRNLVSEKNRNHDDDEVSNKRLTSMALDVSKGLAYLADLRYVHRDVACRNCLVNANRVVKLADFGMTRPMYENNYYRFNKKGMLPVRWMAPESLANGYYTTMSDIWSYGVLLYEILTFGAFPFQGMSNSQVLEHVKAGHTIAIPRGVKPQLEYLLKKCWYPNPKMRPSASQIVDFLQHNPRIITPCLDGPQSSVQIEGTDTLDLRIPDKTRKLSLSINNRLPQVTTTNRKRSMSGNMMVNIPALPVSLSEDGMTAAHSNLDALNLNNVMLIESETGEDPLLPPAQYVSSSKYVTLSQMDEENSANKGEYCTADIARDLWTSVTPV